MICLVVLAFTWLFGYDFLLFDCAFNGLYGIW